MADVDEATFTRAFLSLLHGRTGTKLDDDHVCQAPSKSKAMVVPLPEPAPKQKQSKSPTIQGTTTVTATLKSIRGVKFTAQVDAGAHDTVYTLKTKLLEQQGNALKGYRPANIKLLIKGKVHPDSQVMSEVADDDCKVSFTVMLSAPKEQDEAGDAEPEPLADVVELSNDDWGAIKQVLTQRLGESKANVAFSRLQKGW